MVLISVLLTFILQAETNQIAETKGQSSLMEVTSTAVQISTPPSVKEKPDSVETKTMVSPVVSQ